MNISKISVIHPFLFAIFPIISIYANNMQELLPNDLLQPVLIILIFTTIIFFLVKLVFKVWAKVGIVVSLIIGLMFSYGYIYLQIGGYAIGDFVIGKHMFLIIPYIIIFFGGSYFIFKTKKKLENVTKILNAIAITLIVISLTNISIYAIENNGLGIILETDDQIQEIGSNKFVENNEAISLAGNLDYYPDIYFIILDGYGGTSSLKNDLDFDNSEFINMLKENGFFVVPKSHSNYPQSFLSIPSTMNMKYLNYLSEKLGEESKDQLTPMKMMNNFLAMKILKSKGYKTVNFLTTDFKINADVQLCEKKNTIESNELMSAVSKINIFEYILTWIELENTREQQECYFSEISEIHKKYDEPVFIFAHILVPHPPNVFGSNGEQVMPRIYYNAWGTDEDKRRYLDTLQYANLKIEEFVVKVLKETSPKPIIIIQSDHGTDFNFDWDKPSNEMLKQRFSNLNAYYFPKGEDLLYDNITPVNSFRIMFNSNFNGTFEILDDKSYWSSYDKPYKFTDITEIIREN